MNKVAMLLPDQELCDAAAKLVGKYDLKVVSIEAVSDELAVKRALELESEGVDILICRGVQAMQIRQAVHIAVVEIRITTQELGLLLVEMKRILPVARPKIAFIALDNTLRDTSHCSDIFGVDLLVYRVRDTVDFPVAFQHALQEQVHAIIGGRTVEKIAEDYDIPTGFMHSGEEGIADALAEAQNISFALTVEKKNTAQMQTLLDYAFEGIMQINAQGIVVRTNSTLERLIGKKENELLGISAYDAIPKLNSTAIYSALTEGAETFGHILELSGSEVMVNVAPVKTETSIDGAILAFHESSSVQRIGSRLRQELYMRGLVSRQDFSNMVQDSKTIRNLIVNCRVIAKYDAPLLLIGEPGSGRSLFARCIHNETSRRENGFVTVDCTGYTSEYLDTWLFGSQDDKESPTMVELAQDGTLYLKGISALSIELQHKIYLLTQGKYYRNGTVRSTNLNVRIIASSDLNLLPLVQEKTFRSDLFYALSILTLDIPPLRLHKEDITGWVDLYMDQFRKKYSRYIHLSQSTYELFRNYNWPGNLNQVSSVCERIVLLSPHRTADTIFVQQLLEQVYPDVQPGSNRVIIYKDKHAVEISELLKKHNGNREKVAQELGISKTTLWRKMKKYNIGSDFSV